MKNNALMPGALALAVACALALPAHAQEAAPISGQDKPAELPKVNVRQRNPHDDTRPKLQHIMREVDGPLITVTKKTSITKTDSIPTVVDNNLRDLFAQTPGLFYSEQQTPGQLNFNYRGIGNPQESEFVTVLFDGIPLESDWIGYPTIYTSPLPQQLSEVQLIRGGSSLLYLLIQRGAAASVTSLMYLVPPTTALMAWLLFGEPITVTTVAGIALTALGVALVVRSPTRTANS